MKKQFLFFLAVSVGMIVVYVLFQFAMPVNPGKGPEEIRIAPGTTFRQAAEILKQKGYIGDRRLFVIAARITGADRTLKAGYYVLSGNMPAWVIFQMLKNGRMLKNQVTIVEGDSLLEIRRKLIEKNIMSAADFDRLCKNQAFLATLNIDAPSLEGYLFPATYSFPKGDPPELVFADMVDKLMQEYNGQLRARTLAKGLNLRSVLTMASMVEKEAVKDSERSLIAAVFYNRLKQGMPLQSDPTAVYGVKPFCEGVTSEDLKRCTKYNTYKIKGLPPGPIDCPGLKSIKAALYPAKVNYLYFESNYDGTHTFSDDYESHKIAILNSRAELKEKQNAVTYKEEIEQTKEMNNGKTADENEKKVN
ncbi:MAG: endolytic transglycosylase MltG [Nitrospiraceae bacterium]|nr:endolytic transglycosylase MltG [Nitrospiraceae bacterium]